MVDYVEIEGTRENIRLNKALSVKLNSELKRMETRTIGYPAGSFHRKVHFLPFGDNVLWWEKRLSDDKAIAQNFFGHGTLGEDESLTIDVQFNVPIAKFSRRSGGAFLRHIQTGKIVLAHQGIVTLGHRLP